MRDAPPSNPQPSRSPVWRLARGLRDAWLIVGVVLAMLAGLEVLYRAQASFKLSRMNQDQEAPWLSPRHPEAGQPWWRQVTAVTIYGTNIRYDPYRGFWPTPMSSPVINVDSAGLRRTWQPRASDSGAARVMFLGGSVMWGWIVRDSFTIPSLAAERFAALGRRVRVTNHAQPTFQITQETATLLLELRAGRVPDVVVFYDGVNEITTAYESGNAGHIYNEQLFANRFAAGRERSTLARLAQAGTELAIVQRLGRMKSPPPVRGPHPEACPEVARQYVAMTRVVESLGREFHFRPVFLWQPMLATSRKPLGSFERSIGTPLPGWRDMAIRCTAITDSLMAERPGTAYYNLRDVFDGDTGDVFWDEHGHLTEAADRAVAHRIVALVTPLLPSVR